MKNITRFQKSSLLFLSLMASVLYMISFKKTADSELPDKAAPNTFVVLELFTSQGCSSCPAADELMRFINREVQQKKLPVYMLSFHVDYWDYLGWRDSFSDPLYTARQYRYARAFSKKNIYTPQMIANGNEEFIGSDESACTRVISAALQKKIIKPLQINGFYKITGNTVAIHFKILQEFSGYVNIALLQKEADIKIHAGENNGRSITYADIVRDFKQIDFAASNQTHITMQKPVTLDNNNLKVLIYLQNKDNMKILAVTTVQPA